MTRITVPIPDGHTWNSSLNATWTIHGSDNTFTYAPWPGTVSIVQVKA